VTTQRLPGSLADVEASPEGPRVGAFFDLDGTLIAGYSARYLAEEQLRTRQLGVNDLVRTVAAAARAGAGQGGFEELLRAGAAGWRGRLDDDMAEMGERLFRQKIEQRIYPEMRELVRAHQQRGHFVALSSSATAYQVEPVARFLGIEHVLCNRFEAKEGVLTGDVQQPVLWGPGKSEAVQRLAAEHEVDLHNSYFYADGNEDLALMHIVGHPRPTNPGKTMEKVAANRGWPVLRFDSRGSGGPTARVRTIAGVASLVPLAGAGVGLGVLTRNKRTGLNFTTARWLDTLFAINGVKMNVTGRENLWAARPAIFIFNHRNNFDAFMTARLVEKDFTGIAKKELENTLIFGTFGKLADVAFVDRSNSAAAVNALQPLLEVADKGLSIIVAPEGTRLDTTTIGPFKKGAFRIAMATGLPIVPIVFRNAESIAARDASTMNPGTVDVAVLPPIPVDDWTLRDLRHRIEAIRQLYIDTLADWPGTTSRRH
jgi:putative phosphoserine phosphatase/1-acylglycerol-3-phosphate O-acyltransferase